MTDTANQPETETESSTETKAAETESTETEPAEDPGRRAARLVENAGHDSVTLLRLLDSVEDGGLLYDSPLIETIDSGEQPHILLFNRIAGYTVEGRFGRIRPDEDGGSLFVFTDRELHIRLGQSDGDHVVRLDYGDIVNTDWSTGRLKHRISLETETTPYALWVDTRFEEADLEAAVRFLEAGGDPSVLES